MANVSGAFLVLILGMALATATAFAEFLWNSRKIFANKNVSTDTFEFIDFVYFIIFFLSLTNVVI